MSSRFRSLPSEVEAVRWTGDNLAEVEAFAGEATVWSHGAEALYLLCGQDGAQGWLPVSVGEWVARRAGDPSDYWPVDPAHFAEKHEPADG